jgi:hypothetical protein
MEERDERAGAELVAAIGEGPGRRGGIAVGIAQKAATLGEFAQDMPDIEMGITIHGDQPPDDEGHGELTDALFVGGLLGQDGGNDSGRHDGWIASKLSAWQGLSGAVVSRKMGGIRWNVASLEIGVGFTPKYAINSTFLLI